MLGPDGGIEAVQLFIGRDLRDDVTDLLPVKTDVLGREGREHVVLVFLQDAVGEGAELPADPFLIDGGEGLYLDGLALGQLVIGLGHQEGADADAFAVQASRGSAS